MLNRLGLAVSGTSNGSSLRLIEDDIKSGHYATIALSRDGGLKDHTAGSICATRARLNLSCFSTHLLP